MRGSRGMGFFCGGVFFLALTATEWQAQEPKATPATLATQGTPAAGQAPTGTPESSSKKYSHIHDFLIRGTVFDEKAMAFPNVQLRIRRASERKFRWESYTNSRGDFAIRVPQGTDYEMVVHTKGFTDQTRAIDAKSGTSEESMVFRMASTAGDKK
jgi:Carboxypeptidase regulatory-like domain